MKYTSERNHQIVIELLKHHGIKKVVASPGGTNVTFVASIQQDSFFEVYSSVDERSAAYIACGLSAESGEPVMLSCTGATAARNYFSGLTEAYYRKLPILAITSTMPVERVGHNFPQVTDRSNVTNDIAKMSVHIPVVKDEEDEWICTVRVNEAILELNHKGKGPVHINLETTGAAFDSNDIRTVNPINRIMRTDSFPIIEGSRIGIFVGAHSKWSTELTMAVDRFCQSYNAVVLCDHTSNYKGKYGIPASLVTSQKMYTAECVKMDLLIHLGDISGAYLNLCPSETWRVNVDGKICDTFKKIRYVFEMEEIEFFERYNEVKSGNQLEYYNVWNFEYDKLRNKIPKLPYSNIWVAKELSSKLPQKSVLHLGILNSLRSWNYFKIDESIEVYSNTGGFGIDGCVSALLGASLASKEKLYFGVVGDLAFFYDMNSLGNRHFGNNVRLLVVNNGRGQEFRNYGNRASWFGEETDKYIAAAGHYGNQSKQLIKNYVENLGFKYLTADNKSSFESCVEEFVSLQRGDAPIVFEVMTSTEDETEAHKILSTLEKSITEKTKQKVMNVLGDKGVQVLKTVLKK